MYFYKPSLNKILIYSIIFQISHRQFTSSSYANNKPYHAQNRPSSPFILPVPIRTHTRHFNCIRRFPNAQFPAVN